MLVVSMNIITHAQGVCFRVSGHLQMCYGNKWHASRSRSLALVGNHATPNLGENGVCNLLAIIVLKCMLHSGHV